MGGGDTRGVGVGVRGGGFLSGLCVSVTVVIVTEKEEV